MRRVRGWIVDALSTGCWLIDGIRPWQLVAWTPLRWLGCPRGMALWSDQLDQRWGTGRWTAVERESAE